jgi:hypothetical protein
MHAIVAEEFSLINNLGNIGMKDVDDMCKQISGLYNAHGGVPMGYNLVHRLIGFVFWVKDHHHPTQPVTQQGSGQLDVGCLRKLRQSAIRMILELMHPVT